MNGIYMPRRSVVTRSANVALAAGLLAIACGGTENASLGEDEEVSSETAALSVTANRSLFITMPSVTTSSTRTEQPCSATAGDEDKVWTIGHLLKREAEKNGITPSTYVSRWMNEWHSLQVINEQYVYSVVASQVLESWNRFASDTTMPLYKAPFYLLAIVNRLDLRKHRPNGEPLGGELRFIFGILHAVEGTNPCPTTFYDGVSTLIFEYSPVKVDDASGSAENKIRNYASRWLALSEMSGEDYRNKLDDLTEEVINNGRLLRIRTNEQAAAGRWDQMEFEPDPETKFIKRSTIKQSPTMALEGGSQRMSDWIWSNRNALYANAFDYEIGRIGNRTVTDLPIGSYWVPNQFDGTEIYFRGAVNSVSSSDEYWGGPTPTGLPVAELQNWREARFRFSVGTCRGCHSGDTGTTLLHVVPTVPGTEAGRSAFLKGAVNVPDPADPGQVRSFNELYRRENDLRALVSGAPVLVPVFGNNYTVSFPASGKCLDSAGNNQDDGASSQLYACHGNGNQRLSLEPAGTNLYRLKYKHSGKCIDVVNVPNTQTPSTIPGARVVQRTCDSARTSQKLSLSVLTGSPPGTPAPRVLKFQHSNLCLLVRNQGTADGTAVVQGSCPASSDFAKGFNLVE
jgi:hypothetical protein